MRTNVGYTLTTSLKILSSVSNILKQSSIFLILVTSENNVDTRRDTTDLLAALQGIAGCDLGSVLLAEILRASFVTLVFNRRSSTVERGGRKLLVLASSR